MGLQVRRLHRFRSGPAGIQDTLLQFLEFVIKLLYSGLFRVLDRVDGVLRLVEKFEWVLEGLMGWSSRI